MGAAVVLGTVAALGAGYQAYTAREQGQYESAVAEQNAQLAAKAAGDALQRGKEDAAAARMRARAIIGAQRAKYAASGVELSGTPVDVLSDTAQLGELDALTIENNAAREAFGYQTQGVNYSAQARLARYSSRYSSRASLLGGLTDSATAYGTAKSQGNYYYLGSKPGKG